MHAGLHYRSYRPGGWTDDLGIIADRNQYVSAQMPGWYFWPGYKEWDEIHPWLNENGIEYSVSGPNVIIHKDEDALLFKMRWE